MCGGYVRKKKQDFIDRYNDAVRKAWWMAAFSYGTKDLPKPDQYFIEMEDLDGKEEQTDEQKAAILKGITAKMGGKIKYIKDDGTEVDPKYVKKGGVSDGGKESV